MTAYLPMPFFDACHLNSKYCEKYFRPTEVESLMADSGKSKELLGWEPRITFDDLLRIMVDSDMRKAGLKPVGKGDKILSEKFPDRWWNSD